MNGKASFVTYAGENLVKSNSVSFATGVDEPTRCSKIKCAIDSAKTIIDRK